MNDEFKNMQATDPELDALLNEALSPGSIPGGVPVDLTQRIVARTAPMLGSHDGVIARIGPRRWAAVAAVAALVLLGIALFRFIPTEPTSTPTSGNPVALNGKIEKTLDDTLDIALADVLEDDINQLSADLETLQHTDAWNTNATTLDTQISDLESSWDDWDQSAWDEPATF